jgi:hypothetical protein
LPSFVIGFSVAAARGRVARDGLRGAAHYSSAARIDEEAGVDDCGSSSVNPAAALA